MEQQIEVGTVVQDIKWGGKYTGTVVEREGRSVFVAWHNSCVEDEMDIDEVEVWEDAPTELAEWRGGIRNAGTGELIPIEGNDGQGAEGQSLA